MSTTKFMTATGSNRELHIKRSNEDHVQIRQFDPEFHTHQAKTFFLDPSEAPALALAILEAAGVEATPNAGAIALGTVVSDLQRLIAEQERATAEARELAELEAEALELLNVRRKFEGIEQADALDDMPKATRDIWLAVARRARELAKEATK